MPKVGVVLSGCGFLDGAEIHESVLTLLALNQKGAEIVCCAPNIDVTQVVDHQTQKPASETRNVLKESARIARGAVRDIAGVTPDEFDALILPGGFGAAKNLCTFGVDGPECAMNEAVAALVRGAFEYQGLPCPWDLTGDDIVGISDLLILLANWGTSGPGDFDQSGSVGIGDLLALLANWGLCP